MKRYLENESPCLYRYIDEHFNAGSIIRLLHFPITRETPACFVINYAYQDKYVLKQARKRFAYPTIELARQSFEIRKRKQLQYLKVQYDRITLVNKWIDDGTVYSRPKELFSEDFVFASEDNLCP